MTVRKEFDSAASAHRDAAGYLEAARVHLASESGAPLPDRQQQLITQLAQAATVVTPGWLGQALSRASAEAALGESSADAPLSVRIGECLADKDSRFPVVVNVLGTGHLAVDGDPSDARVLSIVQCVPLRLLATRPSDSLTVSLVDGSAGGSVFDGFTPLIEAGYIAAPAVDGAGLAQVLDQAEAHLDHARRAGGNTADLPERLLVIAGIPAGSPDAKTRIAALAANGPAARLHLVVAGWTGVGLDHTTYVAVAEKQVTVAGVPFPAVIDPVPPPDLVARLCTRLAESGRWLIGEVSG